MIELREAAWTCVRCGEHMNAATPVSDDKAVPKDGDGSMCLYCGAPYERRSRHWRLMTADQIAALPPAIGAILLRVQIARTEWAKQNPGGKGKP